MKWFGWGKAADKEDAKKFSKQEIFAETLQLGVQVERVLNEYGAICSFTSEKIYGVSETLLPGSKLEIKNALLKYLHVRYLSRDLDQKLFESLEFSYGLLAHFHNSSEINALTPVLVAQETLQKIQETPSPELLSIAAKQMGTPEFEIGMRIFERSLSEFDYLCKEFRSKAKKMGIEY